VLCLPGGAALKSFKGLAPAPHCPAMVRWILAVICHNPRANVETQTTVKFMGIVYCAKCKTAWRCWSFGAPSILAGGECSSST
jgi:hypothetical protein